MPGFERDYRDGHIIEWHCDPPQVGQLYMVVVETWDLALVPPLRKIEQWRPVIEGVSCWSAGSDGVR